MQGLSPKIYLCNNAGLTRRSKHSANSLDPRVKHEDAYMKSVNIFLDYAIESFHIVPFATSAFAQMSNFLAHAINAIFFGFPAFTSRR